MAGIDNVVAPSTDLVGSIEFAARLSPDPADELRQGHFSVLRRAMTAAGGSEVKSLGHALIVVFPPASAALACAVATQQRIDKDNRTAGRDLGLGRTLGRRSNSGR